MSDPDPYPSPNNGGLSNNDIERRTWEWFSSAVEVIFGPAYYHVLNHDVGDLWPDVIALRAHDRVGFEITSPLRPEDVVKKHSSSAADDEAEMPVQRQLEKRVIEALKRKIKKYGNRKMQLPLALLITLAHPSTMKFFSHTDLEHLSQVVKSVLGHLLHQPIDAVYLVGPGERAHLLWRRRGAQWKKLFPELEQG
ncbi:MAG TPA: hypothetical protein VGL38_07475 [bacterium]|jgi:hypothetical protein